MEDEDDYVAYGTPLEREEDLGSNKRKRQALDQGRLRAGSFSQEVYDENGRRRFHGAFTGGFSAGYYNTVGSKEGWAPQSFTSSRKNRAELAQLRPYDYMDDEEKAEQDSTRLVATADYDTFALTAADLARKEAAQELKKRPSAIPGFLPDDIIVPALRSIGFELLRKMGWRHGRSIGPKHIAASSDAQREGRKAMLALAQSEQDKSVMDEQDSDVLQPESDAEILPKTTPIYVINPKNDRYGFGFDPYKNAPEFRERHNEEVLNETKAASKRHTGAFKSSLFRPNVGKMGSGFGIGALEEFGEEDEDVYAPDLEIQNILSDDEVDAASLKSNPQPKRAQSRPGLLPGFKPASHSGSTIELFPPPVVPPNFVGKHCFKDSLESETVVFKYEPPEVPPPEDPQLRKLIDGLATFVARSGQKLESLYMEKRSGNSLFEFLSEGNGHDYYKRKLWEEQKKNLKEGEQEKRKEATLNYAQRGQILGEVPLRRPSMVPPEDLARLQSALSSAFTSSTPKAEEILFSSQPFSTNPPKQARFELYLKEKYQGGLRNVLATGKSSLTEWERAQETLEFEAVCQNLQRPEPNSTVTSSSMGIYQKELQAIMSERFAVQSADKVPVVQSSKEAAPAYPVREEKPWRPRPLLCKRFNLPDPYSGKPPPLPKPRSRTESFILLSNPTASVANASLTVEGERLVDLSATSGGPGHSIELDGSSSVIKSLESEDQVRKIVEKPVDLYKAIFSDEEDEEDEDKQEQGVQTISAEAAHAALNRLEAGDFLASIGKELGLQVPPADFNQMKRVQDSTHPTDVMAKPSAGSRIRHQMLYSTEQNSVSQEKDRDTQKGRHENLEKTGVFLDYPRLELSADHFDVFSKLSSKKSLPKNAFQDNNAAKSASKDQSLIRTTQEASEDSSDSDSESSSDFEKKRRSRKRREKEHRHSKSEKRKSGRDHKRKKRHEEVKHQSHNRKRRRGKDT